ncbi:MAG: hypothetical protein RL644_235, partial [Actinomycetota bacterium]
MRRTFASLLLAAALVPVAWAGERNPGAAAAQGSPQATAPAAGPYIVQLLEGTDPVAFLREAGISSDRTLEFSEVFDGFAGVFTEAQIVRIAGDWRVASFEPDRIVHTQVDQTVNPTGANYSWGLDRIDQRGGTLNGTYSYDAARDGTGVTAYVLDTGVYAAHSDFGGRVSAGWSYRADSYFFTAQNAFDDPNSDGIVPRVPLSDDVLGVTPPGSDWCTTTGHPYNDGDLDAYDRPASAVSGADGTTDNNGHGTHVAGIIGGSTYGVAKNVTIVPVQALNSCGSGLSAMLVRGIEWILTHHTGSAKAVVNMSLGFDVTVGSIDCVINGTNTLTGATCSNYLFKEGIVVVAASGNTGQEDCTASPGSTFGTIAVAASGASVSGNFAPDAEPSYTNFGQCVDMFAPGSWVKSTWTAVSGNP